MLSAGVMATPLCLTADNYEHQFGKNHVGHVLLTKLILPTFLHTATFALSSHGHIYAAKPDVIDFSTLKTTGETLGPFGRCD
jgi:hypothetical protein